MRKEYDFSKARRNPYLRRLKKRVTIRLDEATIAYFKELAEETGIPYQTLSICIFEIALRRSDGLPSTGSRGHPATGLPNPRVCT